MTDVEFKKQVQRLIDVYGPTPYSTERLKLIWRDVQYLSGAAFESIVDEAILKRDRAPLGEYFLEKVSEQRERQWDREKSQHANDAKQFASSFPMEDLQSICQGILRKLKGDLNDVEYDQFKSSLLGAADASSGRSCSYCDSTGRVFVVSAKGGSPFVYRCCCTRGAQVRGAAPKFDPLSHGLTMPIVKHQGNIISKLDIHGQISY